MTAKKSVFGAMCLVMSGRGDNQSPNNRVVDFTIKVTTRRCLL